MVQKEPSIIYASMLSLFRLLFRVLATAFSTNSATFAINTQKIQISSGVAIVPVRVPVGLGQHAALLQLSSADMSSEIRNLRQSVVTQPLTLEAAAASLSSIAPEAHRLYRALGQSSSSSAVTIPESLGNRLPMRRFPRDSVRSLTPNSQHSPGLVGLAAPTQ
jgi:hypothetical protein